VLFLTGRWFKRIAGEALDVYLRTADAHFYGLAKRWKARRADADLRTLFRSVFRPELQAPRGRRPERRPLDPLPPLGDRCPPGLGAGRRCGPPLVPPLDSPVDPCGPGDPSAAFAAEALSSYAEDRKIVALLYGDFLDGPILHRLDDKTSVQLLGNS